MKISYNYIYLINTDKFNFIKNIEILERQEIILKFEKIINYFYEISTSNEKNLIYKIKINMKNIFL